MEETKVSEPTATETPPVENNNVEQGESTQQPQAEDLLTRVSKFTTDNDPAKKSPEQINADLFNDAELNAKLDSIDDPALKEQMLALRKSLTSGVGKKFQEIADVRKELQAMKEETKAVQQEQWTPERVQSLINDPEFVQAAQKVAGTELTDEYSNLSEHEKEEMVDMKNKIKELKDLNQKSLETQQIQMRQQQHEQYQARYANYDPKEIDTITFDMLNNKIQATPEHIYKAFKHDENVRKAYEMGMKDAREGVQDKVQAISAEGIQASPSTSGLVRDEGESTKKFISRVIADKIAKLPRK